MNLQDVPGKPDVLDGLNGPARASAKPDPGHYPAVATCYKGLYAGFDPCNKEGKTFLSGAEGIIGSELFIQLDETTLNLLTSDNRLIGTIERKNTDKLKGILDQGWTIRCRLAYTLYVAEKKTFSAQLACFCYAPWLPEEHKAALDRLVLNMTDRIASASHPSLELSQQQFNKVLDSKGEWYLTKDEPWPELPKGSVYYRRRRTYKDLLVGTALKGNKGCLVASWAATIVIIAAALFAIWRYFFSA